MNADHLRRRLAAWAERRRFGWVSVELGLLLGVSTYYVASNRAGLVVAMLGGLAFAAVVMIDIPRARAFAVRHPYLQSTPLIFFVWFFLYAIVGAPFSWAIGIGAGAWIVMLPQIWLHVRRTAVRRTGTDVPAPLDR